MSGRRPRPAARALPHSILVPAECPDSPDFRLMGPPERSRVEATFFIRLDGGGSVCDRHTGRELPRYDSRTETCRETQVTRLDREVYLLNNAVVAVIVMFRDEAWYSYEVEVARE